MVTLSVVSVPASGGVGNEDAVVTGDGVVVDGAGLPVVLRAGYNHSVTSFALSIASVLHPIRVTGVRQLARETPHAHGGVVGDHH